MDVTDDESAQLDMRGHLNVERLDDSSYDSDDSFETRWNKAWKIFVSCFAEEFENEVHTFE